MKNEKKKNIFSLFQASTFDHISRDRETLKVNAENVK
jgi:hypothetical protein